MMDDGFIPPVGGSQQQSISNDLINPTPADFQQQGPDAMDPTGVWSKFLSTPGHPATQKQVQAFIGGLLKQLGNQIQNEMKRAKKAEERMKRALNGE